MAIARIENEKRKMHTKMGIQNRKQSLHDRPISQKNTLNGPFEIGRWQKVTESQGQHLNDIVNNGILLPNSTELFWTYDIAYREWCRFDYFRPNWRWTWNKKHYLITQKVAQWMLGPRAFCARYWWPEVSWNVRHLRDAANIGLYSEIVHGIRDKHSQHVITWNSNILKCLCTTEFRMFY